MKKPCFMIVLTVLLAVGAWVSAATETIPAFSAPELSAEKGKTFQYSPGGQSLPTLFVFWASWCTSCRYEVGDLTELHTKKASELNIVGVSVDSSADKALAFQQKYQLPYVSIFDGQAKISEMFKVKALPSLVLVDAAGQVRYTGYRLDASFEKALEALR